VAAYAAAQTTGAVLGAMLANAMYGLDVGQTSQRDRASGATFLAEVVATAGLVFLVFALARTGRASLSAAAVGAYVGAAYWFTSSTAFANPAVTVGRVFSDTFAGIAPASVPAFVLAQLVGGAAGATLVLLLHPDAPSAAGAVVVPQDVAVAPADVPRHDERSPR
jgi:arsenate reductase